KIYVINLPSFLTLDDTRAPTSGLNLTNEATPGISIDPAEKNMLEIIRADLARDISSDTSSLDFLMAAAVAPVSRIL
ncbi:hypothetical protein MMC06_006888, partial [Schaereria dolodes]|nr:hypothetical protein [Schaereria dolodes]